MNIIEFLAVYNRATFVPFTKNDFMGFSDAPLDSEIAYVGADEAAPSYCIIRSAGGGLIELYVQPADPDARDEEGHLVQESCFSLKIEQLI